MKFFLFFFLLYSISCCSQNIDFSQGFAEEEFEKGNYNNVIKHHYTNTSHEYEIERIELIAKCYNKLEDYYKEIEYYEIAINLNNESRNYSRLISNYIDIAKSYKNLKNKKAYNTSITYLLLALSLKKKISVEKKTLRRIHHNLGNYYKRLSIKNKALFHYNKALLIAESTNDSLRISNSYFVMAALYLSSDSSKGDLKKVEYYLKFSKQYNKKSSPELFINQGIVEYLKQDYYNALMNQNKALEIILKLNLKNIENLPQLETLISHERKAQVLDVLFEKIYAWIKYAEQQDNSQFLKEGLKTIELADKIIGILLIETKEEKTKVYWRKRASQFYFLGVHICHLLNNSEKAFYFSEKNKALLLLNNTLIAKQNASVNVPDSLVNKEINLKKDIYSIENLLTFKNKEDSLKKILFDRKYELAVFYESLKTRFPNYIKNDNSLANVLSIKEIQNKIKDTSTCYISYLWNKSENQFDALYGIVITKNKIHSFKINNLKKFNKRVTSFKTLVAKPFVSNDDQKNFQDVAFLLYTDLFPIEIRLLIKHKKLVIIPDSDLSNIPFEALIKEANTNNYLIKNHEISYAYSLSFLIENNTLNRNPDKDFLGFAPLTFDYDDLETLNKSETEVIDIKTIINGEVAIDIDATKQKFFSEINNYKILHLSTHANANDSIAPWIAFKNEKLYLNELYTTKNQANLVVLSACNSSLGKLKDGEGVFSLARGFFYSGSKSVMSSLWNVNDKSNAEITTSFYNYLKNGKTKSAALRQAKLNYLNTHSLSEVSPYYWSSLVLIGDTSSIYISSKHKWAYYLLSFLILVLIFFYLKKNWKYG